MVFTAAAGVFWDFFLSLRLIIDYLYLHMDLLDDFILDDVELEEDSSEGRSGPPLTKADLFAAGLSGGALFEPPFPGKKVQFVLAGSVSSSSIHSRTSVTV